MANTQHTSTLSLAFPFHKGEGGLDVCPLGIGELRAPFELISSNKTCVSPLTVFYLLDLSSDFWHQTDGADGGTITNLKQKPTLLLIYYCCSVCGASNLLLAAPIYPLCSAAVASLHLLIDTLHSF